MATAIVSQPIDVSVSIETDNLTREPELAQTHKDADHLQRSNMEVVRGKIFRKRKYRDNVSLAIRKLKVAVVENENDESKQKQQQQQQQKSPPVLVMVPRSSSSMSIEGCFLGAIVEIGLAPITTPQDETKEENDENNDKTKKQNNHRTALSLNIIRCSPDPNAIQDCLRLVVEEKLSMDIFSCETSSGNIIPLLKDVNQATEMLSLNPKDATRRAFVRRISSGLEGKEPTESTEEIIVRPRKKKSKVKPRSRKILERMEASQKPMNPTFIEAENESGNDNESNTKQTKENSSDALVYNLPDPNDASMMSGRHPITRREYLHDKKWPQIRWLVKRLAPILEHLRAKQQQQQNSTKYIELLDVGGGRGDLAVAVAEAYEDVRVTVVDLNESSLKGGRAYYQSRKPANETDDRVLFVCGDFAEYAKSSNSPTGDDTAGKPKRFDVVTAWHACGDLSDYALEFAIQETEANANAFVICPCCYTKRYIESFEPKWIGDYYEQQQQQLQQQQCVPCTTTPNDSSINDIRTIQKLSEINELPEITHRAMGLINTMRLRSLLTLSSKNQQNQEEQQQQGQPTFDITLEEYDLSFSSKNLVLVGIKN